jgi:hypothetical protein
MNRLTAILATVALSAGAALAQGKTHHVVVHIDAADPAVMNLALNNLQNIEAHYTAEGDTVVAEVVAIGPGLMMYVKDRSPVADRIAALASLPDLTFSACGNTLKGMEAHEGHPIPLIDQAKVVPSGAVRLVELQEQGYSYIKP